MKKEKIRKKQAESVPLPHNPPKKNIRSLQVLFPLLIVLLTAGIYSNTLHVPFVFDDPYYVSSNPAVKDFRYYLDSDLVKRSVAQEYLEQNFLTRKATFFTFSLNYWFHGLKVPGYHIVNILIHMLNGLLIYWFVLATLRTPYFRTVKMSSGTGRSPHFMALFTALLFVAHPIQTQAVTYVCQRFTSFATLFYLLAIVLYVHWRLGTESKSSGTVMGRTVLYWLSFAVTLAAMWTKEITFTLPLVIILYEWMFFAFPGWKRLVSLLPFIMTLLIIPMYIFGEEAEYVDVRALSDALSQEGSENAVLTYLFTQFRVIITYMRLLFLPVHQHFDYDYPKYMTFFQFPVAVSFSFLCLVGGTGVYLFRKAVRTPGNTSCWQRLIAFGIFWFFLTLSVESTVIPLRDFIFEHRLYLPSVGFFLVFLGIAGIFLEQPVRSRVPRIIGIAVLILAVSYSSATISRNRVWQDKVVFLEDNIRKSPNKARQYHILADEYYKRGQYEDAYRAYTVGLKYSEEFADIEIGHTGLAEIYALQGDSERLQRNYEHYLDKLQYLLDTNALDRDIVLTAIATVYGKMNRTVEVEPILLEVLEIVPELSIAHYNLGKFYLTQNQLNRALTSMREGERRHAENYLVQEGLGDVLVAMGQQENALKAYLKAQRINPELGGINRKIAQCYVHLGSLEKAIDVLWKDVEVGYGDATLYKVLGNLYEQLNRFAEAEHAYLRAVELYGNNAIVLKRLGDFHLRREQFDKAVEYLGRAAKIDPLNQYTLYNLGYAFFKQGKNPQAAKAFHQVLVLSPTNDSAREHLEQIENMDFRTD